MKNRKIGCFTVILIIVSFNVGAFTTLIVSGEYRHSRRTPYSQEQIFKYAEQRFLSSCLVYQAEPEDFKEPIFLGKNLVSGWRNDKYWYSYKWVHQSEDWQIQVSSRDDGDINSATTGDNPPRYEDPNWKPKSERLKKYIKERNEWTIWDMIFDYYPE